MKLIWSKASCSLLAAVLAAQAVGASAGQILLDFPSDKSLGKVYLLRPEFDGSWARGYVTKRFVDARGKLAFTGNSKLALMGSYALTEGMPMLRKLPPDGLVYLDLRKLEIKSEDLANISHLKGLQELDLQNTDIDDGAIKYLVNLSGLVNVGLSKTLITGQTLTLLGHCPNLQILDIGRTPFNDKYIEGLTNLKHLYHLSIEECGLTDDDLEVLCKLKNLSALFLAENKRITTKGLRQLARLKNLRSLSLGGIHVDEQGFDVISKLHLDLLVLRSDQIIPEQLAKLRLQMPKTKIDVQAVGHMPIELFAPVHKMQ